MPSAPSPSSSKERGFTLLVAIWAMALLAFLAVVIVQSSGRHATHVRLARDLAVAEASADAGVALAILDLLAAREERRRTRRFALGEVPVLCRLEDGVGLAIAVQDEAGRVDLNQADEQMLMALLIGIGRDLDSARRIAAAIADFRDRDDTKRPDGAEAPEYRSAGLAHGPKNAPFAHVDELALVLGVERDDVERLLPHVTVHAGMPSLEVTATSAALKDLLAKGAAELGLGSRAGELPSAFTHSSTRRVFRVASEAHASGAVFHRETIVALGDDRSAYAFKTWRRAESPLLPAVLTSDDITGLPKC